MRRVVEVEVHVAAAEVVAGDTTVEAVVEEVRRMVVEAEAEAVVRTEAAGAVVGGAGADDFLRE
jgi:hypothetical protein